VSDAPEEQQVLFGYLELFSVMLLEVVDFGFAPDSTLTTIGTTLDFWMLFI